MPIGDKCGRVFFVSLIPCPVGPLIIYMLPNLCTRLRGEGLSLFFRRAEWRCTRWYGSGRRPTASRTRSQILSRRFCVIESTERRALRRKPENAPSQKSSRTHIRLFRLRRFRRSRTVLGSRAPARRIQIVLPRSSPM